MIIPVFDIFHIMENRRNWKQMAEAQQNVIQRWPELTTELLSYSNCTMNEDRVSRTYVHEYAE